MTRKNQITGKTTRANETRRARQWKRWGAYLAECEWALLFERELAPVRIESRR